MTANGSTLIEVFIESSGRRVFASALDWPGWARSENADFGALREVAQSEHSPLATADGTRLASLLEAAWSAFDQTAAAAPAQLRKGPRGDGRDTDQIVAHVRDVEALYARKMGVSLTTAERARPDAPDLLRGMIAAALRDPGGLVTPPRGSEPA